MRFAAGPPYPREPAESVPAYCATFSDEMQLENSFTVGAPPDRVFAYLLEGHKMLLEGVSIKTLLWAPLEKKLMKAQAAAKKQKGYGAGHPDCGRLRSTHEAPR